ncbi:MAG: hypothetical protein ACK5BV_09890 [Bacteroidota bacterium]
MASPQRLYYFTKEDPDYQVKGSRDPLAIQVLWQQQGKKLIPYLSTVSSNIHDFQILCLAYYFYEREPDAQFIGFFLRLEQLMAYARHNSPYAKGGFNGIEAVRKRLSESERVSVSNTAQDNILSNQRVYGIWGKYSRPFRDIGFLSQPDFKDIFSEKMSQLADGSALLKIIQKLLQQQKSYFHSEDLLICQQLFPITPKERSFYRKNILEHSQSDHYQNHLFEFLNTHTPPQPFHLYQLIHSFTKFVTKEDTRFHQTLDEIIWTEKVIAPVNHIFRYLQTQPIWTKEQLLKDDYIHQCKNNIDYRFPADSEANRIKNEFAQLLQGNNWDLVLALIKKNIEVTEWRGGSPWITVNNHLLEVHHAEGGFKNPDYNPEKDFSHGYFMDTYLGLFQQIMHKK